MRDAGRLLGVDFGTKRVGLAICDPDRIIASPLATYERRDEPADAAFFRQLFQIEKVVGLVVGLPVHMSGQEGTKAAEARAFGTWLTSLTGLPVAYFDERYTTSAAEGHLRSAGLTRKQRAGRIDRVAAQLILQAYIEAGCPAEAKPDDLT